MWIVIALIAGMYLFAGTCEGIGKLVGEWQLKHPRINYRKKWM